MPPFALLIVQLLLIACRAYALSVVDDRSIVEENLWRALPPDSEASATSVAWCLVMALAVSAQWGLGAAYDNICGRCGHPSPVTCACTLVVSPRGVGGGTDLFTLIIIFFDDVFPVFAVPGQVKGFSWRPWIQWA